MTEEEYMAVADLWKLRLSYSALREVVFIDDKEKDSQYREVCSVMRSWISDLEKIVQEKGDD